jgi:hypothetical protein
MRRPSLTGAILVLLLLGFSFADSGEDFSKNTYDQSDGLSHDGSVLISSLTLQAPTSRTQISPATAITDRSKSALSVQLSAPSVSGPATRTGIHAGHLAQPRHSLASHNILRC